MFKKNKCKKCGKKVKDSFDFCPYCGKAIGDNENWGMLGKNDFIDPFDEMSRGMLGGMMGGKMLNKMLGSAMKMLEKELQKNMAPQKNSSTKFELYINGKKVSPENIKLTQKSVQKTQLQKIPKFSSESLKRFSGMPKIEPRTSIRRLADKVVYEIEIPGVTSMDEISVAKLENSIEIKAVGEKNAYSKVIPINLQIKKYELESEKLVLELGEK